MLWHADLSPDQLLGAIAGWYPDLRDTWTDGRWQLCAIDATRGHSRDRSLMHSCYMLVQVKQKGDCPDNEPLSYAAFRPKKSLALRYDEMS